MFSGDVYKRQVFDKTGTMTKGVFEVSGIHHNEMEDAKLLEYAAYAECSSSHPISKSLQKAYGKPIDRSRVTDIEEIGGNGVIAKVDGVSVAAGNAKLMNRLGIAYKECHHVGTVVHMACLLYTSESVRTNHIMQFAGMIF